MENLWHENENVAGLRVAYTTRRDAAVIEVCG